MNKTIDYLTRVPLLFTLFLVSVLFMYLVFRPVKSKNDRLDIMLACSFGQIAAAVGAGLALYLGRNYFYDVLQSGTLGVFCLFMISVVATDVYQAREKLSNRRTIRVLLRMAIVLVLLNGITCCFSFAYYPQHGSMDERIGYFKIGLLAVSGIFCILAKTILLVREIKEKLI